VTDTIDKALAWDVIAEKNAEITRLREALAVAGLIMQRAIDCYYVASGKTVIDGQDGYGPLREMRLFLEGRSSLPPAERTKP